jgi:hypothetical protein
MTDYDFNPSSQNSIPVLATDLLNSFRRAPSSQATRRQHHLEKVVVKVRKTMGR